MIPAPSLYIGGHLMRGDAADIRPVLDGLNLTWGTTSTFDFEDPATLNFEVLLKPGATFVSGVGVEVGLVSGGRTIFAGRISGLQSRKHPTQAGHQLLSVTCTDTLADLMTLRAEKAEFPTAINSGARINHLRKLLEPNGWEITGEGRHAWPEFTPQRWLGKEILTLIDMHARASVARRLTTSTYTPGAGIRRRITFVHERLNVTPGSSTPIVRIPSSNVREELEWEKNPDDLVTDVKITHHRVPGLDYDEESTGFDIWVHHYKNVDLLPLQRAYGVRSLAIDIDALPGTIPAQVGWDAANPLIGYIVNQWANADAKWRPVSLAIADSRKLSDASVYDLLDVTRRAISYVVLTDLPAGNPSGFARVEAYVTAGAATWSRGRWHLEVTLGRQTAASEPI